jgi:hypothetical protein
VIVLYGAPSMPGGAPLPWERRGKEAPQRFEPPAVVWPEAIARELRELREMVQKLRAGTSETTTQSMARQVVESLLAADPACIDAIEEACRCARERPALEKREGQP